MELTPTARTRRLLAEMRARYARSIGRHAKSLPQIREGMDILAVEEVLRQAEDFARWLLEGHGEIAKLAGCLGPEWSGPWNGSAVDVACSEIAYLRRRVREAEALVAMCRTRVRDLENETAMLRSSLARRADAETAKEEA